MALRALTVRTVRRAKPVLMVPMAQPQRLRSAK
jgi:hypothetical protein